MRFLIFGDVVGKPGRLAVARVLPQLREEMRADSVIINIENIAHGMGISPTMMDEVKQWRADVLTTGDHAWDNEKGIALLNDRTLPIIRPADYPAGVPGRGYCLFRSGAWQIAVINLQGPVFFKNHPDNPFHCLDRLLAQEDIRQVNMVLVDFHVEASSEARAFGWHVDGRVAAVWGTHTHVPTADAQILPGGTGYISNIGMQGNYRSIIGGTRRLLTGFLQQTRVKFEVDDPGQLEINSLLLDVDPRTGRTVDIAHIRKILDA